MVARDHQLVVELREPRVRSERGHWGLGEGEGLDGAGDLLLFGLFEHLLPEAVLELFYHLVLAFDLVPVLCLLGGHLQYPLVQLVPLKGPLVSLLLALELQARQLVLQVFVLILEALVLGPDPRVHILHLLLLHLQLLEL